ncbi:PKD domain-containing protein [Gelidibacter japonicus]|uniref:PKD domain-containing protein n=1 Tax=Gelidibacter japonicus TaxID=1962232 RepID=UPI002021E53F|nr:PKD domain-containing protein [Gelidibacter japonicus]MCL8007550.1 PKD domain-containing protein [Gelidibacter japonicus]
MKTVKYIFSLSLIVLTILGCSQDDVNTDFVDKIAPPSNVSASVTVSQDNTGAVTITPIGDGAVSFNVDFGDSSDPSGVIPSGRSLKHIYEEGTYTLTITANGLNGLSTTVNQQIDVSFKAPQNLMVTIENDGTISKTVNVTATADFALSYSVDFGDGSDPVMSNINDTTTYTYQEAGVYTITITAFSAAIETTSYTEEFEVIEILQPVQAAPTQPNRAATDVISIFSDAYENIAGTDFYPNWGQSTTYNQIDIDGDHIIQYGNLNYQGIQFGATADASQMEFLHIDVWTADENMALDIYPISVATGEKLVKMDLVAGHWNSYDIPLSEFTSQGLSMNDIHQIKFDGTPAGGTIFIDNLYFYKDPSGPSEPESAAPTPTLPADDVISVYSDDYTSVGISELNPNWSQTTVLTEVVIDGNNTWKYELLNYTGIVTSYDNPTDVSAMTHVHFDYWTPDATSLGLKLVNTGSGYGDGDPLKEDIKYVPTVVTGSWVSVALPLSEFTTDRSAITQLLFESSGATVYIDNLYFYIDSSASSEPEAAAPTPTLAAANVISIYSDAYTSVGISELNPNWSQTTQLTEVVIDGNNTWKYELLNYTGIVTSYDNPTDVSAMTHVHFDYWTPDATSLGLKLVNTGSGYGDGDPLKEDIKFVSTVVNGSWVSVDIPLSDFTTDLSGITQLLFESSGATVYIDNLYFHN